MPPPSFWRFLAVLGIPWFVGTSLRSTSIFTWLSSLRVRSVFSFPSYQDTSGWIRVHPHPVYLHLNLITSAKTLFSNKVTFTGFGWI